MNRILITNTLGKTIEIENVTEDATKEILNNLNTLSEWKGTFYCGNFSINLEYVLHFEVLKQDTPKQQELLLS